MFERTFFLCRLVFLSLFNKFGHCSHQIEKNTIITGIFFDAMVITLDGLFCDTCTVITMITSV